MRTTCPLTKAPTDRFECRTRVSARQRLSTMPAVADQQRQPQAPAGGAGCAKVGAWRSRLAIPSRGQRPRRQQNLAALQQEACAPAESALASTGRAKGASHVPPADGSLKCSVPKPKLTLTNSNDVLPSSPPVSHRNFFQSVGVYV